tara:strand:- start:47 stop:370 length:324 start_codon:yes stop_codon:yes gene_type:complete
MKKIKIFIYLNIFFLILSSCGTVKESFKNQNKNSADEFLVEKKSPLIMPPNFDQLPNPNKLDKIFSEKNTDIEILIKKSKNKQPSSDIENETFENFEKFLLKKIKNN